MADIIQTVTDNREKNDFDTLVEEEQVQPEEKYFKREPEEKKKGFVESVKERYEKYKQEREKKAEEKLKRREEQMSREEEIENRRLEHEERMEKIKMAREKKRLALEERREKIKAIRQERFAKTDMGKAVNVAKQRASNLWVSFQQPVTPQQKGRAQQQQMGLLASVGSISQQIVGQNQNAGFSIPRESAPFRTKSRQRQEEYTGSFLQIPKNQMTSNSSMGFGLQIPKQKKTNVRPQQFITIPKQDFTRNPNSFKIQSPFKSYPVNKKQKYKDSAPLGIGDPVKLMLGKRR